jgi:hypothetical protein
MNGTGDVKWILLGVVVIVVLGVIGLVAGLVNRAWWAARSLGDRVPRPSEMELPPQRCLRCQGTGWINRQSERTFTFTGDGFEDVHTPATVCPACGGTGAGSRDSRPGR